VSRKTLTNLIVIVVLAGVVWGISQAQRAGRAASLIKDLVQPDDYAAYRSLRKISGLGTSAAARALRLLTDPQPYVRARAAILVGETRNPRHAAQVLPLLQDPAAEVRVAAASALGSLGWTEAAAPLIALVEDEGQPLEVRTAATRSLALLAAPEAVPAMQKLLALPPDEQHAPLREAAIIALGACRTPEAIKELRDRLRPDRESSAAVRTLAAEGLARAATPGSAEAGEVARALLDALHDEASEVRIAAAHSLGQVFPPQDQMATVNAALQEALGDSHYWVREAAEEALR